MENDNTTLQAHHSDANPIAQCGSLLNNLCYGCEDGLIIFTETGNIVSFNEAAAKLFDYDPASLIDEPISTIIVGMIPSANNGHSQPTTFSKTDGYLTQMHTGKRRDGVSFPLEMLVTTFVDASMNDYMLAIVRDLHEHADYQTAGHMLQNLSPRQLQVLRLVAEGYTSREIAKMLTISVKTVETHRANIMAKLGVRNVTGLVRFAMANNIV